MESCPSCGAIKPHEGSCPGLPARAMAQAYYEPHQISAGHVLQGRYEILHMLGQGGMGTVYMARDLRLKGRSCVVKKLRDDFYRDEDRQQAQECFQREMEVLADLEHHNIVGIKDYFPESGNFFLVMEYVQGNNLHHILHEELAGEPFTEETVINLSKQICDVLIYLHEKHPPIIYRDLKPSNVMIDVKGEVKLVDFGIARRAQAGENTHVISAGYSPPEQYWGASDARSDIYSLGATIHFLLTGQDPEALHTCSPRSINPNVSEALDRLVQKATAQELSERFQTANELWEALLHVDYEQPPQSVRGRMWEAVIGIVLLVVCGFIFFIQMPQAENSSTSGIERERQASGKSSSRESAVIDRPDIEHAHTPALPAQLSGNNASAPKNGQNERDLAVQVTDEKELTDPAGLAESHPPYTGSAAAKPKKKKATPSPSLFQKIFGGK